jgi:uncharacterized protein Veg
MVRFKTFDEVNLEIERIEKEQLMPELKEMMEREGKGETTELIENGGRRMNRKKLEDIDSDEENQFVTDNDNEEEDDDEEETSYNETDQDEEQENVRLIQSTLEEDQLQAQEFDREFNALLAESLESRKSESRKMTALDMAVPTKLAHRHVQEETESTDSQEGIAFTLLIRKGNKPQTKTIFVPSDSHFASSLLTKMEAEKAEQQELKRLVLGYEQRNDEETTQGKSLLSLSLFIFFTFLIFFFRADSCT